MNKKDGHIYAMVPVGKPEDNLHELILSIEMQVPRLDLAPQAWKQVLCSVPYLWFYSTSLKQSLSGLESHFCFKHYVLLKDLPQIPRI